MKNLLLLFATLIIILLFASACKKSGDQNKPFILVNPPDPLVWAQFMPYIDPGAEAFDVTESGDTININDRLKTTDNIDVNVTGEYLVKFNVSDEAGNNADEKTRNVRVVLTK